MTTEDSSASSSASECSEKIGAIKAASDLLAQGTRSMVCGEIPKAVNLYEEAVQLLVKSCGELSRDCADAYYCCGSALLELGRMETNVLGAALEGVDVEEEKEEEVSEQFEKPPEEEGEERQKLREEVYEAMAEGDREEEFKKVALEKSQECSTEGGAEVCDKSNEVTDMETDEVCEKGEDIAVKDTTVSVENSSNTTGGKSEEVTALTVAENQHDNKIDANVSEASEKSVSCKDDLHSQTIDVSKQEEKMEDSEATNAEKNTSTGQEGENVNTSATDESKQEKMDDNVSLNTEKNTSVSGHGEIVNTPTSDESKPEEKMDDSEALNAEKNNLASGQENVSILSGAESKQEEKIDDCVKVSEKQDSTSDQCENVQTSVDGVSKPEEKVSDSSAGNESTTAELSNLSSTQEKKVISTTDENKQEEKIDDSPAGNANVAEKLSDLTSAQEKEVISTTDESKQEVKMDDSPAEKESISPTDESKQEVKIDDSPTEKEVISPTDKQEVKIDDSPAEKESISTANESKQEVKIDDSTAEKKGVSPTDESKQEVKIDDSTAEKKGVSPTDESKQEVKIDDSPAEKKSVSPTDESKQEVKVDDSPAEKKSVSPTDESKQEEKIDDSPAEKASVTEELSNPASTQEKESTSTNDKSKQEEKVDDSAVENGKLTDEHISSGNKEETINTPDIDKNKQECGENEQVDLKIKNNIDNVDKTKCVEVGHCNTLEGCEKIDDQVAHTATDGDSKEKVVADVTDATAHKIAASHVDTDVEMADNDDEDDEEDEDVNADGDIQEVEKNGDEKEEDIPNFQLAWEYLDLAKVIYLKSDTSDDQLKAALCHIKLGELSMETEQHATAVEDLENAFKIQQKFLPSNDRQIAETHYQLGLAFGFSGEYEKSVQSYTEAIKVIESKIESLRELVKEKGVNGEDKENVEVDQWKKYEDEIQELQVLIPEIKIKIEDTNQEVKDMEQLKHKAKEALVLSALSKENGSAATETAVTDNSEDLGDNTEQKASDIAHLVRKKRKPDSDLLDTDIPLDIKKLRPDGDYDASLKQETEVNGTQLNTNVGGEDCCLKQNEDEAMSAAEPVAS